MRSFFIKFGDHFIEFFEGDGLVGGSFPGDMDGVQHLKNFIIADAVSRDPCETFELFEIQGGVLLLVDVVEDGLDSLFGLDISNLRADDFEELIEVDGLILGLEALNEAEGESALPGFSQLVHDLIDFQGIDGARVVLIEEVEHILELLVLLGHQSFLPADWLLGSGSGGHLGDVSLDSSTHIYLTNKTNYIYY